MAESPPSQDEALCLHRRLLDADPTANLDLAEAYLDALVSWLEQTHVGVAPDLCAEAAGDALLALIAHPLSYSPERQTLEAYLRMSAQGDLRNLLRKERRHQAHRKSLESVELSDVGGKYLGRDDDPSLPLQIAEEARQAVAVPASVRHGLTEAELRVLELMLGKEYRTAVYAEAYGISHLSKTEQQREVKRVKDRLQKRLERARGRR